MHHPRVHVKITFVSTKAGKAPSVSIKPHIEISKHIGVISCKNYEQLKTRLGIIVRDTEHEMYFHKDNNRVYSFDESALPYGAIYGMKERRTGDSDSASKFTASKLIVITSAAEFENHINEVAAVVYKRRGRRNMLMQVNSYTVVLIKEKKKKRTAPAPTSTIVCRSVGGDKAAVTVVL